MRTYLGRSIAFAGLTTTFGLSLPYAAGAETFHCANEDVQCLIFAINHANTDAPEKSTITLEPGTYTLTTVDNNTDDSDGFPSRNGLPSISGDLAIRVKGKGTATLTRSENTNTPFFRLLHVAATGHLTLRGIVVANGLASKGGGLLNSGGEVTLDRTTFSGNHASGNGGAMFNSGVVTIKKSTFV